MVTEYLLGCVETMGHGEEFHSTVFAMFSHLPHCVLYVCVCICVGVYTCVYMYMWLYVYIYTYIHIHTYIHTHTYVYTYTPTHTVSSGYVSSSWKESLFKLSQEVKKKAKVSSESLLKNKITSFQRDSFWGSKFCFSTPTKGGTCLFPFFLASLVQEEFTFHFLMPALRWYNNCISFILKSLKYFHIHYFQLFMQIISVASAMIYFNIVF